MFLKDLKCVVLKKLKRSEILGGDLGKKKLRMFADNKAIQHSIKTSVIIARDSRQCDEKSGVGIFSPNLESSYSFRLPNFTPVFVAEFLAMILALQKLNMQITLAVIITDSLSLCTVLSVNADSHRIKVFRALIPLL